jgi:hypothetical protein
MTKWYWPTWSDWLAVYDQPVTNWAYKGYANSNFYWTILDKINLITPDDHVIIEWTQNHRVNIWYDRYWVDQKDVLGFFPDTNGQLWYTNSTPYTGMYRLHTDYQPSYTNMLVDQFQIMLNTQMLLDKIGCKYTMFTVSNPWWDGRPIYSPAFQTTWQDKKRTEEADIKLANTVININPIKNLLEQINWSKYANAPNDPLNPIDYSGIWEYYINNKEYVLAKHISDNHPTSLAHHDFLLEVILKKNPMQGKHRKIAKEISEDAMTMHIPEFNTSDYVAPPNLEILDIKYKNILGALV